MAGQDRQVTGPGGFALGVDLGTSNTVAVLRWPDGRTRPLLFDGQPIMPSGVLADQAGGLHVGRDAQRLAQAEPARYEPNPKRRVDEPGVLLGDREVGTVDMLAAVLAAVARAAVEAVGFLPPAVLTYPAAWGGRRREVLAAAVARAGWPPVDLSTIHTGATPYQGGAGHAGTLLVPEPVAAARYFADVLRRPVPVGASLAVFDFGGGTLDVAVIRNEGTDATGRARFTVLGSGGVADLGGLDLDAALVDHLGALLAASAPHVWQRLSTPQSAAQARDRRQFWDDVRGAKEMLSRTSAAPVAVPGVEQALHVTREELEHLAAPLLRQGVYETARVITACQLASHQLAGLFLVGGSSRVPLVARLLHSELGIAPTVLEQPELPVAEGALAELVPPPQSAALAAPVAGAAPTSGPPVSPAAPISGSPAAPISGPPGSPGAPISGPPVSPAKPGQPAPYPMPPEPGPRRRPAVIWLAAAAAVMVVLAGVGGVALYLNSRGPADLDFQDVTEIARIATSDDAPYYAFSHTVGDRAYLAWQREEQLEVISVEASSGSQRWQQTMPGTSERWRGIVAYPNAVLAIADSSSNSEPRAVHVLDPDDGHPMWSRDVFGEDSAIVYDEIAVLVDVQGKRLVGLDIRSGEERWTLDNPKNESDQADAGVFPALTEADLAGAATPEGLPFVQATDDDYRIVQVGSDRKARMIDARTGKLLAERGNVGDPTGKFLAYEDRFFAVGTGDGYHIDAYDLDQMGEPRGVYRAPDKDRVLDRLVPCGERVCVLDSRSADAKTREVAAIDAAAGGQVWRQPAPQAETLVPVGDSLLVQVETGSPSWTLRDDRGNEVLRRDGTAARLDAANALSFVGALSSSTTDLSIAGVGVNAGKATELGPLREARGDTCSWNANVITCLSGNRFVLWRFAE